MHFGTAVVKIKQINSDRSPTYVLILTLLQEGMYVGFEPLVITPSVCSVWRGTTILEKWCGMMC